MSGRNLTVTSDASYREIAMIGPYIARYICMIREEHYNQDAGLISLCLHASNFNQIEGVVHIFYV